MRFKFHASQLPPLCCAAFGVLLALVVVGGIAWQQSAQSNQAWAQMYGESLAAMTANSAIDSTLNHDLVSLQVVLQDVVRSPRVVFATIHDVEHNLLVQGGLAPSAHQMGSVESYSAAIGFQQSVAGYVSVHIDKPKPPEVLWWAYWGGVFLALLVAALALIDGASRVFERCEIVPEEVADDEVLEDSEEVDDSVEVIPTDEVLTSQTFVVKATAQIVLQIADFSKLQKTLSAARVAELKVQWLAITQTALDLYGGQWASAPSGTIVDGALIALFPSAQSEVDAIKTAAFFGSVVKDAFKPPHLKVRVDAIVGLQDEFMHLSSRPASSFAVYFNSDEQRKVLAERIRFTALDGCWWQLDSFNMGYQALLDKQAAQLSECLTVG